MRCTRRRRLAVAAEWRRRRIGIAGGWVTLAAATVVDGTIAQRRIVGSIVARRLITVDSLLLISMCCGKRQLRRQMLELLLMGELLRCECVAQLLHLELHRVERGLTRVCIASCSCRCCSSWHSGIIARRIARHRKKISSKVSTESWPYCTYDC